MTDRVYGMGDCPLNVKTPEFMYNHCDPASNLTVEFGIGEYAEKTSCQSYIDINSDNGGSYELEVAVKIDGKWALTTAEAVRVKISGSYERAGFKYALQKAGLMTVPFYGTIKDYWEG